MRLAPVMFELGARPHPPRALYRSYLAQSDVFVGIYWQRYGWVAPDMEISGLEDEFVLSAGMPRLIYLKRPAPDMEPRLKEMLSRLEGEDSASYKPFTDGAELHDLLLDDLAVLLTERFDIGRAGDGQAASASRSRPLTNLPAATSSFLGRDDALVDLRTAITTEGVRLLTLTGPGGTGKTRLALEAAAEQLRTFQHGVFFVDLSAERDPDAAFAAVARTLEVAPGADGSPLDALISDLRERSILLVLDNLEQVTSVGPGVVRLLEQCPNLKIIATSREPLRVRPERVFQVPPLLLPAAEQLFTERASAVSPGFDASDVHDADVAAICRRLDGLPLAVELAAGRVKLFSVSELRAELEKRLDVLKVGARDLPARQRTLRNAIEWSDDLLTRDEKTLFRLLSVFSSARLSDIEATCERVSSLSALDVVDAIGSLVDKSLVRVGPGSDGRPRFSMLETIREYAVEQRAAIGDLVAAMREAHAEHYTEVAIRLDRDLTYTDRAAVLAALRDDLGNLRAAWDVWVDRREVRRLDDLLGPLWGYYEATGDYRSAIDLGEDLLRVLSQLPDSPERRYDEFALRMNVARTKLAVQGFTPQAEAEICAALARAEAAGDAGQRFPTLRTLASLQMMRSELDQTAAAAADLLEIAEKEGDRAMLSEAHLLAAISRSWVDHLSLALDHADEAVAHFRGSTSGFVEFRVGPNPGVVAIVVSALLRWMAGYADEAVERMQEALSLADDLDHPSSSAYALHHATLLDLWRLDPAAVVARADHLRRVAETYDFPVWHALALVFHGTATVAMGEPQSGLAEVEEGFSRYEGLSTPPVFWPALLMIRATARLMAGEPEAGLAIVEQADQALTANDPLAADIAVVRGDLLVACAEPDPAAAAVLYEEAAELAGARGARMIELQALTRLAALQAGSPAGDGALRRLRECYDGFTEGFTTAQLATARALLQSQHVS